MKVALAALLVAVLVVLAIRRPQRKPAPRYDEPEDGVQPWDARTWQYVDRGEYSVN